ncbi:homoserine dehydrogenase [Deferribacterales bacterium RsTz2092]
MSMKNGDDRDSGDNGDNRNVKDTVNIGIIGYGVVGSSVVETIRTNGDAIYSKTGIHINIVAIARKDTSKGAHAGDIPITSDVDSIISNPDIDIIVELVGGGTTAKEIILKAIAGGKHVVTANKALLATHGREIFNATKAAGVELGFEASVGGGIPLINTIKESLVANNITEIAAVINGTSNYILSQMSTSNESYDVSLKKAQDLGYAEADPTFDVEGVDSAHKITILASIAFGAWVDYGKVHTEGITRISAVDIAFAKEQLHHTIKLLAIAKRDEEGSTEVHVHPTLVPNRYILSSVSDAFNAATIKTDKAGTTIYFGRGAGGQPTSSAVVADISAIARNICYGGVGRVSPFGFITERDYRFKGIEETISSFYLRFNVTDASGVLSAISGVLAKHDISIKCAFQRPDPQAAEGVMPLIFLTYSTSGQQIKSAVAEIGKLDIIHSEAVVIRVME